MAQDNLAHFTADGKQPRDPLLLALLEHALTGQGSLQRLSPRRTVLRLDHLGSPWLLKLDAPVRPFESLRALVRRPSMQREAQNWNRLARRWPVAAAIAEEAVAEQLDPARGCFARPWMSGRTGRDWGLEDAGRVGRGMSGLHLVGWSDPDLNPGDLLLDQEQRLLPMDLGHAKIGAAPTPTDRRRRDLMRLFGGWPTPEAHGFAPGFWEGYAEGLEPPGSMENVLEQASTWRDRILARQSRRCLRRTRDFDPWGKGIRRTEGGGDGEVQVLTGQGLELGRETFRELYEQELHGHPGLRPTQLEVREDGSWILTGRAG
jgi:hypothetical protein